MGANNVKEVPEEKRMTELPAGYVVGKDRTEDLRVLQNFYFLQIVDGEIDLVGGSARGTDRRCARELRGWAKSQHDIARSGQSGRERARGWARWLASSDVNSVSAGGVGVSGNNDETKSDYRLEVQRADPSNGKSYRGVLSAAEIRPANRAVSYWYPVSNRLNQDLTDYSLPPVGAEGVRNAVKACKRVNTRRLRKLAREANSQQCDESGLCWTNSWMAAMLASMGFGQVQNKLRRLGYDTSDWRHITVRLGSSFVHGPEFKQVLEEGDLVDKVRHEVFETNSTQLSK
mmetsp:Transcript_6752/g.11793  ORF Transcript_6752/g.11793 Transcript_6752/m.11793 type:complete len:288 (-) Transcript_6752:148-1011(-)